jgi:hypothetical protein
MKLLEMLLKVLPSEHLEILLSQDDGSSREVYSFEAPYR